MDFMAALIDLAGKLGPWPALLTRTASRSAQRAAFWSAVWAEFIRVSTCTAAIAILGVKMKTQRKIKRRRSRKLHAVAALRVG